MPVCDREGVRKRSCRGLTAGAGTAYDHGVPGQGAPVAHSASQKVTPA